MGHSSIICGQFYSVNWEMRVILDLGLLWFGLIKKIKIFDIFG